jgi:rhodanese-related sulfurtransferase
MKTLTAEKLTKLRDENHDFLLINTLDESQFGKTKIPGSINIPQAQEDFVERVEQEAGGKDKKIVVYCANEQCNSSPQAAEKLEQAGFTEVYDFETGAEGWQEAGQELAAV